jgi:hypothetical protein
MTAGSRRILSIDSYEVMDVLLAGRRLDVPPAHGRPAAVVEALRLPEDLRGSIRLARCCAAVVGVHGADGLRATWMPGRVDLVA